MKKFLFFAPLLVFVVLGLALGLTLRHGGTTSLFAKHVGETVPPTRLPLLASSAASLATDDWRGKPYAVNFFASWCSECRAEHAQLLTLGHALPLIGIAYKDKTEAVAAYLKQKGNPFQVVAEDVDGHAGIDWGLTGVPETFLVDAGGIIRMHILGRLTEADITDRLLPAWQQLVK